MFRAVQSAYDIVIDIFLQQRLGEHELVRSPEVVKKIPSGPISFRAMTDRARTIVAKITLHHRHLLLEAASGSVQFRDESDFISVFSSKLFYNNEYSEKGAI